MREMKLQDLKAKTPAELVSFAEELEVENASTMRKQELMFGILKQLSMRETDIIGEGVVEVLSDGFGFLRSPEANYLPGPDDIYVSPSQIRRFGLRTGDTIDGHIRSPKDAAALGIETVYQDLALANHLDASANLFLGREAMQPGMIMWISSRHRMIGASLRTALRSATPQLKLVVCTGRGRRLPSDAITHRGML